MGTKLLFVGGIVCSGFNALVGSSEYAWAWWLNAIFIAFVLGKEMSVRRSETQ